MNGVTPVERKMTILASDIKDISRRKASVTKLIANEGPSMPEKSPMMDIVEQFITESDAPSEPQCTPEPQSPPEQQEPPSSSDIKPSPVSPRLSDLKLRSQGSSSRFKNAISITRSQSKASAQFKEMLSQQRSSVDSAARKFSRHFNSSRRRTGMDASQLEQELNSLSADYISKLAQENQTMFLISIHSKYKVWWDALLALNTLYSIVLVPMDFSFELYTSVEWLRDVQLLVDTIYLIDIALMFRTSYIRSSTREEIVDIKSIRQHYLTTWFVVDVLSSIPTSYISQWTSASYANYAFLRLTIFFRILRLSTSPTFSNFMAWASRKLTSAVVRLIVLVVGYLLLHHYIACGYYLLVQLEGHDEEHWNIPFDENDTFPVKYIGSYYQGLFVTSGSDVGPKTLAERIFGSTMYTIGIVANACVAGICASLLDQMTRVEDARAERKENIATCIRHINVGDDLQEKIKEFYDSAHAHEIAYHPKQLFCGMPDKLQFELSVALNATFIQKVPLFHALEPDGVIALMQCLEETVAMAGDLIIRSGEMGRALYMIKLGSVEVYSDNKAERKRVTIKQMHAGQSFGEMSLIRNTPTSANVVATSFCVLLVLHKNIFQWIIAENEQVRSFWERSRQKQMETSEIIARRASTLTGAAKDIAQEIGIIHHLASRVLPHRMKVALRRIRLRRAARRVVMMRTLMPSSRLTDNNHSQSQEQPPQMALKQVVAKAQAAMGQEKAHKLFTMILRRNMSVKAMKAVSKMSQSAVKDLVESKHITLQSLHNIDDNI